MFARLAAALSLLCLPALALAQTSEEDWEVCPKIENEQAAIEACTRIIERKGEGRERTGIAYSNRCGARGRLGGCGWCQLPLFSFTAACERTRS